MSVKNVEIHPWKGSLWIKIAGTNPQGNRYSELLTPREARLLAFELLAEAERAEERTESQ